MTASHHVSNATVDQLETRMRMVIFAVTGQTGTETELITANDEPAAAARVRALDRQLQNLASRSQAVANVLDLHSRRPDVFHAEAQANTSLMKPTMLAQMALSHLQQYQKLSAQLTMLQSQSLPETAPLAKLAALQPRIDSIIANQNKHKKEVSQLVSRSAAALEGWQQQGILEMSEHWADWEERLRDVEILVRRMEAAKKREEGLV